MKFLVSTAGIKDNPTADAFSRMADTLTNMLQEGPAANIPARAPFGSTYFETDGDNRLFWYAGETHGWLQMHTDLSTGDPSLLHNKMSDLEGGADGHWFHVPTPTEGGLLYGNDTPAWTVLAHPAAANRVLVSSAAQVAWTTSLTLTALTLSNMTEGSVLFAGAGGVVSQDNTKFFWKDDTDQLLLGVGDATKPPYSYVGRTTDGQFSAAPGALGWAIAGAEKMRLTATGLGILCTPAYPLDVTGTARVSGGINVGTATSAGTGAVHANDGSDHGYFGVSSACYYRMDPDIIYLRISSAWRLVFWSTGIWPYTDNALDLGRGAFGWRVLHLSPANTTAPVANGEIRAYGPRNAHVARMGDTNTYLAGTVSNVDSALPEFLSSGGLVQTMWSGTVDKDLWVTGKPINVFAPMRVRVPAVAAEANPPYICTVEILLGTEVICGQTFQHTWAGGESSAFYYVELHARVTKYAGTALRDVALIKQSERVLIANWVEGAHLELTEYAEGRADPVTEDVTTANVTLQVRVTFSHAVEGLSCRLMDGGWGAETPVL